MGIGTMVLAEVLAMLDGEIESAMTSLLHSEPDSKEFEYFQGMVIGLRYFRRRIGGDLRTAAEQAKQGARVG